MRVSLATLCLAVATSAQDVALLGQVVRSDGSPLADAIVSYHAGLESEVDVLSDWLVAPDPEGEVTSKTGPRGRFSIAVADAPFARAAGVLVVTHGQTGAVVTRPWVQLPGRVICLPLGHVSWGAAGDVEIQVRGRGESGWRSMGWRRGVRRLALPPADYRLLVVTDDLVSEHEVSLQAGQSLALKRPTGRRIAVPADDRVMLSHRPRATLPTAGGVLVWHDAERPVELLVRRQRTQCERLARSWIEPGRSSAVDSVEERFVTVCDERLEPIAEAQVVCLQLGRSGRSEPRSIGTTNESGSVGYVPATVGQSVLVAWAPGRAPSVVDVRELAERDARILLGSGHSLRLQLQHREGLSMAGVRVQVDLPDAPVAGRTFVADRLGRVHCRDLPLGPVDVCVRDDRFAPAPRRIVVESGGAEEVLSVDSGITLRGEVVFADGSPGAYAVVDVTDPRGLIQPRTRTVRADANGRFEVTGLPDPILLRVGARAIADGRSFITPRIWANAPEIEPVLRLQSEDPEGPGR